MILQERFVCSTTRKQTFDIFELSYCEHGKYWADWLTDFDLHWSHINDVCKRVAWPTCQISVETIEPVNGTRYTLAFVNSADPDQYVNEDFSCS